MQPLHATSNFKTISFHQVKRSALRLGMSEYPMTTCDLEVNSKLTVFIYLVVFLLDFHSDFIMVSTRSCNFLDVCV